MGTLSDDLKSLGYGRTEKESPFHDDAILWTNGVEFVCEETAIVIRKSSSNSDDSSEKQYHEYPNSGKIRMYGGYFSSYEWGRDEDGFYY